MAGKSPTQELQTQRLALINQAKALTTQYNGGEMPPEAMEQANALLGKSDELKARIDMQSRIASAEGEISQPQVKAADLSWRDSGPSEGDVAVDKKSWRELEVKTMFGAKKIRYNVPMAVEQNKEYPAAFEAYMRVGPENMRNMYPKDWKTLTVATDTAGGFMVPPDFHAELIKKIAISTVFRQLGRVIQTSRDVAQWPRVNYSTDNLYTSPVRLTWTGESPASATTARVTDPTFGLINIPVNTAMASFPISNNLLEDAAFDVMGVGSELLAESFALGEENAFLNGSGISQPMGLLTIVDDAAGKGITSAISGATSAPWYTYAGLLGVESGLPPQYERNAVWLGGKATFAFIRQITVGSNAPFPLWSYGSSDAFLGQIPQQLLGYPVYKSEFMPASTTSGNFPLVIGDFAGYMIVDRVGFSVQRLSELYAETNLTVLLARRRVGGQVTDPWRFKAAKIST